MIVMSACQHAKSELAIGFCENYCRNAYGSLRAENPIATSRCQG